MLAIHHSDSLSIPSLAFPLRLRKGLLQKTDERDAYLVLLEIMARTPEGSWGGHASFGFREFFSVVTKHGLSAEQRIRVCSNTVMAINTVLMDLGLTRYKVDSLVIEPSPQNTDSNNQERASWGGQAMGERGVMLMLRETGSDCLTGYSL